MPNKMHISPCAEWPEGQTPSAEKKVLHEVAIYNHYRNTLPKHGITHRRIHTENHKMSTPRAIYLSV